MSSRNPFLRYRLNVEDIMQRYNWSGIATGSEPRPGTGSSGNPGDRNSVATQIRHWDMRNKALKEFLLLSLPADWNGKFTDVSGGGYELWQAIVHECEKENVKVNTELLASLYNASQGVREPLNDYVARLNNIIQELKETNHEVSETTAVMCFFNGLNAWDKPEDVEILLEQQLTLQQAVNLVIDFAVFKPKATQSVAANVQSSTSPLVETQQLATHMQKETSEEKSKINLATITATPPQSQLGSSGGSEANPNVRAAHVADNKVIQHNSTSANPTSPPSSVNAKSSAHQTAFELTTLHRGLKNAFGEHNCFLNVTIQALWHLGPFRTHLTGFIKEHSSQKGHHVPEGGLLEALCNLFVEYEFTNQNVLPATQLRDSLAALSDDFKLGEVADANEALDVILQRIHTEQCEVCPQKHQCLSHAVFGGCIMEQSTCPRCNATSEPTLRSDFILCFQAAELLLEAKALFAKFSHHHAHADEERQTPTSSSGHLHLPHVPNLSRFLGCARRKPPLHTQEVHTSPDTIKGIASEDSSSHHYANTEFGHILSKCMQLNQRSCPSRGAFSPQNGVKSDPLLGAVAVPYECMGRATVHQYSLDPPLAVALSIGWMQERETAATLQDFYDIIAPLIKLSDLFSVQAAEPTSDALQSHSTSTAIATSAGSKVQHGSSTNSGATGASGHATSESKAGSFAHHAEQEFLYTSPPVSANNPAYVFRGLVCYYGAHYVSIFQGSEAGAYLLFDDYTVKSIGDWEAVKFKCVRAMYQPVLLLYELEKR